VIPLFAVERVEIFVSCIKFVNKTSNWLLLGNQSLKYRKKISLDSNKVIFSKICFKRE
jgi:hypothetical protein